MRITVNEGELRDAGTDAARLAAALSFAAGHMRGCLRDVEAWAPDLRLQEDADALLRSLLWAVNDARAAADELRAHLCEAATTYHAADTATSW